LVDQVPDSGTPGSQKDSKADEEEESHHRHPNGGSKKTGNPWIGPPRRHLPLREISLGSDMIRPSPDPAQFLVGGGDEPLDLGAIRCRIPALEPKQKTEEKELEDITQIVRVGASQEVTELKVEILSRHVLPKKLLLKWVTHPFPPEGPRGVQDRLIQQGHHSVGGQLCEVGRETGLSCGRVRLSQEISEVPPEFSRIRSVELVPPDPSRNGERLLEGETQIPLVLREMRAGVHRFGVIGRSRSHGLSGAFRIERR
jgi:hypothetical protein